jgi:hypothetical protein
MDDLPKWWMWPHCLRTADHCGIHVLAAGGSVMLQVAAMPPTGFTTQDRFLHSRCNDPGIGSLGAILKSDGVWTWWGLNARRQAVD